MDAIMQKTLNELQQASAELKDRVLRSLVPEGEDARQWVLDHDIQLRERHDWIGDLLQDLIVDGYQVGTFKTTIPTSVGPIGFRTEYKIEFIPANAT